MKDRSACVGSRHRSRRASGNITSTAGVTDSSPSQRHGPARPGHLYQHCAWRGGPDEPGHDVEKETTLSHGRWYQSVGVKFPMLAITVREGESPGIGSGELASADEADRAAAVRLPTSPVRRRRETKPFDRRPEISYLVGRQPLTARSRRTGCASSW